MTTVGNAISCHGILKEGKGTWGGPAEGEGKGRVKFRLRGGERGILRREQRKGEEESGRGG